MEEFEIKSRRRLVEIGVAACRVQEQIEEAFAPIADQVQVFRLHQQRMSEAVAAAIAPYREHLEDLAPLFERAAEVWARLPEGTRRAQDMAASRGWYVSVWDHPLAESSELMSHAEQGDIDALEDWLACRTRENYDSLKAATLLAFPMRSDILDQAFEAHERGHYGVSIPTLLAQADGIHFDLLEQHLFRKNNRRNLKKRLSQKLGVRPEDASSSFSFLFLRPLITLNALGESTQTRDRQREVAPITDPLNRHGVLHGMDVGYAKELNSLRTLSLLEFLVSVRNDLIALGS